MLPCPLGGFGLPLAEEMQCLPGFPLNLFLPSVTSPAWCSWVPSSTGAVWLSPAALQGLGTEQSHQHPALQHLAGLRAWMRGWVPALQSYFLYFSLFLWHLMQGLKLMALGRGAAIWGTLQAARRSQPSSLQLPAAATTLPLPFGLSLRATSLQG